jgi:hypothetical protein
MEGDADLFHIVGALHPEGGIADALYGGQQQGDQDGDDGDDHQQLDQRKSRPARERLDHGEIPFEDVVSPQFIWFVNFCRVKKEFFRL